MASIHLEMVEQYLGDHAQYACNEKGTKVKYKCKTMRNLCKMGRLTIIFLIINFDNLLFFPFAVYVFASSACAYKFNHFISSLDK